jgi:hypothetical protein
MPRITYEQEPSSDDRELYHVALQCEMNRQAGHCVNYNCQTCNLNIVHYTTSLAKAGLVKATANVDANRRAQYAKNDNVFGYICLVTIAGIILAIVLAVSSCNKPVATVPQDTIPIDRIEQTLKLVRRDIKDLNDDGLVNCIDYAKLFKKYYGYNARIIRNINKDTGMDHLLNAVMNSDKDPISKWIIVEPQGNSYTWRPNIFWGSKYNSDKDYDETWLWQE